MRNRVQPMQPMHVYSSTYTTIPTIHPTEGGFRRPLVALRMPSRPRPPLISAHCIAQSGRKADRQQKVTPQAGRPRSRSFSFLSLSLFCGSRQGPARGRGSRGDLTSEPRPPLPSV